ncbi:MAG: sulfatase, partial [Gemmatimonadota bacterium]
LAEQPRDQEMLYDLIFDPDEADNRAGDPRLGGVLTDLRGRLERWMRGTGDPLLEGGRVAAPSGARVNPADGRSPREKPDTVP